MRTGPSSVIARSDPNPRPDRLSYPAFLVPFPVDPPVALPATAPEGPSSTLSHNRPDQLRGGVSTAPSKAHRFLSSIEGAKSAAAKPSSHVSTASSSSALEATAPASAPRNKLFHPIAQKGEPSSEMPPSMCGDGSGTICGDVADIDTSAQLQLAADSSVAVTIGQALDAAGHCGLVDAAARATGIAQASEHRHRSPRMDAAATARSKPALPLISYVRSGAGGSGDSTSNLSARSPVERSVHLLAAADGAAVFQAALDSQVCTLLLLPGL